jgi:hypothetical protein
MRTDKNPRSKLKPEKRKGYWVARGWVPVRQPDGTIARRRLERSAGPDISSRAQCQAFCDRVNQMYEERAIAVIMPMTFARAYINYVGAGHPEPKFAERILAVIGEMQVADVDDTVMVDLVKKLFPADAKAGYKNRHLYTPVIAILRMASKTKACAAPNLTRPKGYRKSPRAKIPPTEWFPVVLKELNPDAATGCVFDGPWPADWRWLRSYTGALRPGRANPHDR